MNDLELTALKEGTNEAWGVYADWLEERGNKKARIARAISLVPNLYQQKLYFNIPIETNTQLCWEPRGNPHTTGCTKSGELIGCHTYKSISNLKPISKPKWLINNPYEDKPGDYWDFILSRPQDIPGLLENNPKLVWQFYLNVLAKQRIKTH